MDGYSMDPELLCQGPGLEPHYSAILGLFMHSHGTCYLQPFMDSPRLAGIVVRLKIWPLTK